MRDKIYIEPAASERKYRRLAALGAELGVPVPQTFLEMEVIMPNGEVVHHHKQRSHSFKRNAYNIMFCQLGAVNNNALGVTYGSGQLVWARTTGVAVPGNYPCGMVTADMTNPVGGYIAASGDSTYGVLTGYDTVTAENFNNYSLVSPIVEGTTNDGHHLSHAASNAYVVTWAVGTLTMAVVQSRFFNNNTGGNVIVGEVGLHCAPGPLLLISRDHLGSPVTIPNTGQLKVTYTISLVYPF
jgi:hypothetical protein